jgi:hypothetical protein
VTTATLSPRTELAAAIRRLNARISDLSPERIAEIQGDWHASWAKLQRDRERVSEAAQLQLVAEWEAFWRRRLDRL